MGTERGWQDAGFDAFVVRSSTRLLRTAYLLSGDRLEAEDLLQMTLVRTGRHWSAAAANPEAYAGRVLVNLLHDRQRRRMRRPVEQPFDDAADVEARLAPAPDPGQGIIERDAIVRAVQTLSARQQEVVVLRFFADLSVQDTAAAMGTTAGSVKTQTSRALSHLREALGRGSELQARTGVPNAD